MNPPVNPNPNPSRAPQTAAAHPGRAPRTAPARRGTRQAVAAPGTAVVRSFGTGEARPAGWGL